MTSNSDRPGFDTRLIHAGEPPDPVTGANGVPLYSNNTFAFRSLEQVESFESGRTPHFIYQRYGNPTVRCLELKLADLEGGERAIAVATGMAAISAVLSQFACSGSHVVAGEDLYQVTHEVLRVDLPGQGATFATVDLRDLDAVKSAMTDKTSVLFAESLSNPLVQAAHIPALAEIAHERGALLVVDNTFLSPALLRPLEHGADIVIESSTKYLAGTGQVMGGFAIGTAKLIEPVAARVARTGSQMAPFTAWLHLAGIKTLSLRMDRHSETAASIAKLLSASNLLGQVHYPTVAQESGTKWLVTETNGRFSGLLSFEFVDPDRCRRFLNALQLCTIAVSLGEPETLIWPITTTLLRLAVGLEDPNDIIADVESALVVASA